jgi:1,4-alpha-glucan branching enzyme
MGMGAIPYEAGTAFRVWAPFATNVYVAGEFNGWSEAAQPLTSEGNGYWSTDVPGATVGQQYKYVIVNDSTKFWKNDPYAREVREEAGLPGIMNSLIHPPDYPWGMERFSLPLGTSSLFMRCTLERSMTSRLRAPASSAA